MKVKILRTKPYGVVNTPGDLGIYTDDWKSVFMCKTLELPWNKNAKKKSCIPTGVYKVIKRWSEKFELHFHILDVKNRSLILIHVGNYASIIGKTDVEGCIIVGESHGDINSDGIVDIKKSRPVMKKLLSLLPDEFEIIIE